MRRRLHVLISVLLVTVACGYKDQGERQVWRTFTVKSVTSSPLELVLVPTDCATEEVVVAAGVLSVQTRHQTDLTCLGALKVGSTIRHEKQGERQGCMPGKVQYDMLGDCVLGQLALTKRGTPCGPAAAPAAPATP
jgi:hypothetical protein